LSDPILPDIIIVGHVCEDILPGGGLGLGGTASYAAVTAQRLGLRAGLVTSTGPELNVAETFPGVQVACRPSAETTIFENIYLPGGRKQLLHGHAGALRCADVPAAWRQVRMVYLGSIDQELDDSLFGCFGQDSVVGVMPQGFFRRWDETGQVFYTDWTPSEQILRHIDILTISELDVPDPEALARDWGRFIKTVVITRAERGATVYQGGDFCNYPARPTQQLDPTGAGDVFATAFLIRLVETGDACQAARFANAVASFSVEGPEMSAIPTRAQVEAYLSASE
jgi:sugar/nucleoside kinase (ribokinase family)